MFFVEGSVFPAPESKCNAKTYDLSNIANGCHRHQEKVSEFASTTDLSRNSNYDHGMQDLSRNQLRVVGTITAKDIESSLCGTEENAKAHVNTATIWKEVKNEPTAEYERRNSANTESVTTDVGLIQLTSLQATTCESLKGCKTEEKLEEVTASNGVLDELFQNYVNTLNVTAKTNDLEGTDKEISFLLLPLSFIVQVFLYTL